MPGVPRTKRCQDCKRRRIKCDEDWPTCGGCARANLACSGPPSSLKFVQDGNSIASSNASPANQDFGHPTRKPAPTTQHGSLVLLQSKPTQQNASTINRFRLYSANVSLGPNLTTSADRVAARLAGTLTNDGPRDMMFQAGYLKYIPSRINSSPALRDAVILMCSAYANFQRGLPADQVLNLGIYGKALRSLGRAIDDRSRITTETVAATTIMERLEILFDPGRPFHRARHAKGIDSLTRQRGPPKLDDEFDVQLALENHAALVCQWTVDGGDNFFLRSPWKEFLDRASVPGGSVSERRHDIYIIGRYYVHWPSLIKDFTSLREETDIFKQSIEAAHLQRIIERMDKDVRSKGEALLDKALKTEAIKEKDDPGTPVGVRYDFDCLDSLQLLVSYAMWAAVCNRMLDHLRDIQGLGRCPTLDERHFRFCRMLWMCIPYLRELQGTSSIIFVAPLYLSYQGTSDGAAKDYLMDYIVEVAIRRGRQMTDRRELEGLVLNTANAMAGREPLVTKQ